MIFEGCGRGCAGMASALSGNMHAMTKLGLVGVVLFGVIGTGCAKDEDDDVATASVTSALQASQQGGLNQDLTEVDGDAAIEPSKAAAFMATRKPVGVQPDGCMSRTQNGNTVHVVFNGCTGPFGKMRLDGSADVTFSLDESKRLVAEIVGGKDLEANGRELDYLAKGTLEISGDIRNVTWHVEASGETKRGRKYSRTLDLSATVDVGKRCLQAMGSAHGKMAGYELDVTLENLAVCEGACPTSGKAKAKLTGPAGGERDMEISFDGTSTAHVVTPRGKKLDITMSCEDGEAE